MLFQDQIHVVKQGTLSVYVDNNSHKLKRPKVCGNSLAFCALSFMAFCALCFFFLIGLIIQLFIYQGSTLNTTLQHNIDIKKGR